MNSYGATVTVDFSNVTGKFNPKQHGCNSCPQFACRSQHDQDDDYRKMNFFSARTHDWALWNEGQRIIDVPFIFPLNHLDPADPRNYYFEATDEIIRMARAVGLQVYYRLGPSIEHTSGTKENHFNAKMPEDFEKYAEICAGIVRHYRKGWANGFQYDDMIYWEIWNEPDVGFKMWSGTWDEFAKFFAVVCKRLKSEFPEIKVCGPGACWANGDLFQRILKECKALDTMFDVFSWHAYTLDAQKVIDQPAYIRGFLDDLGCKDMELSMNEWHYLVTWSGVQTATSSPDLRENAIAEPTGMYGLDSAIFNLAVLNGWQDTPLNYGNYYGARPYGMFGYYDPLTHSMNKIGFSMMMFGSFLRDVQKKVAKSVTDKALYVQAGRSEDDSVNEILIANYHGDIFSIEVDINGLELEGKEVSVIALDSQRNLSPFPFTRSGNKITLYKDNSHCAAYLITVK